MSYVIGLIIAYLIIVELCGDRIDSRRRHKRRRDDYKYDEDYHEFMEFKNWQKRNK